MNLSTSYPRIEELPQYMILSVMIVCSKFVVKKVMWSFEWKMILVKIALFDETVNYIFANVFRECDLDDVNGSISKKLIEIIIL